MNSSLYRKDQGILFNGEESQKYEIMSTGWVTLLEGGSSFIAAAWGFFHRQATCSGTDQRLRCGLNKNIVRMHNDGFFKTQY